MNKLETPLLWWSNISIPSVSHAFFTLYSIQRNCWASLSLMILALTKLTSCSPPAFISKKRLYKKAQEWSYQYGDPFTLWLGEKPMVILNSNQVVRQAFVEKRHQFSGRFPTKFGKRENYRFLCIGWTLWNLCDHDFSPFFLPFPLLFPMTLHLIYKCYSCGLMYFLVPRRLHV